VFTPRHPATHPKMEKILEGEKHLDEETLIQRALDGTEVIRV
jgi:thiamine biosynthesis protein ThiI